MIYEASLSPDGTMKAARFCQVATSFGLLAYQPRRKVEGGQGSKTSSVIQSLLVDPNTPESVRWEEVRRVWARTRPLACLLHDRGPPELAEAIAERVSQMDSLVEARTQLVATTICYVMITNKVRAGL